MVRVLPLLLLCSCAEAPIRSPADVRCNGSCFESHRYDHLQGLAVEDGKDDLCECFYMGKDGVDMDVEEGQK